MPIFSNPSWILRSQYQYSSIEDIPLFVFKEINDRLDTLQSEDPVVSIVIPAWNEEANILNCISSLSYMETKTPLEIIVVNNNSSDKTQSILDRLNIKSYFQNIAGCGPARQMGQENAKGKYILLADADCIYPSSWVDQMTAGLSKHGVVCVYGRYSFLACPGYPRWKLFVWESLKDCIAGLRHLKRPYLNAYGMSMGYIKNLGLKVGFVDRHIRGEDGRLCFDLMRYGRVKQIKSRSARVWTMPRTLQLDGSIQTALLLRVKKELSRLPSLLNYQPPHDTKSSKN